MRRDLELLSVAGQWIVKIATRPKWSEPKTFDCPESPNPAMGRPMCRLWLDLALSTCPPFVRGARPTQSWLGLKLIATVIHHRVDYNHHHQYDRQGLENGDRPVDDELLDWGGADDLDDKKDLILDDLLTTTRLLAGWGEDNLGGGVKIDRRGFSPGRVPTFITRNLPIDPKSSHNSHSCRHITVHTCSQWSVDRFSQFQGGNLTDFTDFTDFHSFKEDILWKVFCEGNSGGKIYNFVNIFILYGWLAIENGNSDCRTGRLVWKCVSDHFLTTASVASYLWGGYEMPRHQSYKK